MVLTSAECSVIPRTPRRPSLSFIGYSFLLSSLAWVAPAGLGAQERYKEILQILKAYPV